MDLLRKTAPEKYGVVDITPLHKPMQMINDYRDLTQIIYLKSGTITIDFTEYSTTCSALYFIRPGQYVHLNNQCAGNLLFYTPHLYAQDIDDHDLVLGGMLFNGKEDRPGLELNGSFEEMVISFLEKIRLELSGTDSCQNSMIRSVIKQLIITCTRVWRQQYGRLSLSNMDSDFSRFFERLVEHNFLKCHSVAEYAQMLNISPKALNKRVSKYCTTTPGSIIRQRIILEAKRMLIHTPLTVKEISYKLGYDDPSYFIRFFGKQVNMAPQYYRRYFQSALNAVA